MLLSPAVGFAARRPVKDNRLESVFEGGKLVIPPPTHGRAEVWALVNSMPAEVRDDGVPRRAVRARPGEASCRAVEQLMAFLNALGGLPLY